MESDKIEKLVEKYFEATTTLSEEAILRDYFSGDGIAVHLERYAPMFRYFEGAKTERSTQTLQFTVEVPTSRGGTSNRKFWYTWGSVAAMVLIMVGVYFSFETASSVQNSDNDYALLEDQYTQEEIAAAQEALALLSANFSKGTEQLSHLNEFEKNTNRFLNEER